MVFTWTVVCRLSREGIRIKLFIYVPENRDFMGGYPGIRKDCDGKIARYRNTEIASFATRCVPMCINVCDAFPSITQYAGDK